MLLPILSAILGILAFLPFKFFWIFGLIFLIPFFVFLIKEEKLWKLLAGGLVFRVIFSLGTVYFTLEPILWLLSIPLFLGLPIAIYLIKKLTNFLIKKYNFKYQLLITNYYLPISLPFLWTFFDHLQARYSLLPTYIITAGNSLGSSPFLGLASIGGLILLTFFAALINILIAAIILNIRRFDLRKIIVIVIVIVIVLFSAWQISIFQLQKNSETYENLENSLKIAAVSVNEKFNCFDLEKIKNEITNREIEFLILPEDIFNDSPRELNLKFWRDFAQKINAGLLATGDRRENNKRYNSSVLIDKNGVIVDIHNKNRLTFIGEYWLFGEWQPFYFDWIKKTNPEVRDYVVFNPQNPYLRGEKKLLTIKRLNDKTINFASPICLEIHYPNDIKKYKEMGAQFIINPTSNRWLDLGLSHFLYLTNNLRKIQSVWLKTPIISSGVKDFAGVIEPTGVSRLINFENQNKNYGLFMGEIRF